VLYRIIIIIVIIIIIIVIIIMITNFLKNCYSCVTASCLLSG